MCAIPLEITGMVECNGHHLAKIGFDLYRSWYRKEPDKNENGRCLFVGGFVCLWLYDYLLTQKNAVF